MTEHEHDPYLWLEEVLGERALSWVGGRNAESRKLLAESEAFDALQARILEILDSDAKIPIVGLGYAGRYFNFWRDAEHERGILRSATFEQYTQPRPEWQTELDLDELAKIENENWIWNGSTGLFRGHSRTLFQLSRGGSDATVVREFDLPSRSFVEDGFRLPDAKHLVRWRDPNALYVGTDFGPGSLTDSGYPRIVKEWQRGTPLESAVTIYEGETTDVSVGAYRDQTPGYERDFVYRTPGFFTSQVFLRRETELVRIEKPDHADCRVWRDWVLFRPRAAWRCGSREIQAGTLMAAPLCDWLEGKRDVELLFEPTDRASLEGYSSLHSHLLLNVLDNVKNRIEIVTPLAGQRWQRQVLPAVSEFCTVNAWGVDARTSNAFFMTVNGFLKPTTLYHGEVGQEPPRELKKGPVFFESDGLVVSQHDSVSADGTRVPYFQVSAADLDSSVKHPTILNGYGGFEVSLVPEYSGVAGAAWLEQGGVWVVANIRGGGEFGPDWHRAALKEKRPRAYEDFIAVGEDLIRRGITSPARLGVAGGSNGGLLVGNMLTMRPDLFGAIACGVPLLDMRRYHKLLAGASWMAEYGDPDDEREWAYIRGFSPYHQVKANREYPPILFLTSTRDDRVHPGHARKMAARMLEQGHDVTYYENVEGGHAGAATNAQSAFMQAMRFEFLWRQLRRDRPEA